jgi:hypothetical protein
LLNGLASQTAPGGGAYSIAVVVNFTFRVCAGDLQINAFFGLGPTGESDGTTLAILPVALDPSAENLKLNLFVNRNSAKMNDVFLLIISAPPPIPNPLLRVDPSLHNPLNLKL